MAQQIDWQRLSPVVSRLVRDGVSPGRIAVQLGLSRSAVRNFIDRLAEIAEAA
ncbi:MAG: hypothetical protein ABF665_06540 [Gluconacetobacter sp.]